ncbi:MAG: hypothetical protein GXX90_10630 [Microbacteriaceae bacterium]|nr:hypothetical protein [Microbacteriaceae bacterium]
MTIADLLLAGATVPPTPTFDPAEVTPGPVGFFATIGLMLAVGLIAMGLMNRMSRLQARYAVREELEREEAARAAEEAAAAEPSEPAAPAERDGATAPEEPGRA